MDAIAFFALGGVFTSAMSGNTVLLGIGMGQGHFSAALHSFVAILGYVTGVGISSRSLVKLGRGSSRTLGLETLFLAAFVILWIAAGTRADSLVIYGLIGISAIAMGLQGGIGRALGVPGVMTVIFTSTYTALVSEFMERARAGHRPLFAGLAMRQVTSLAAYLGGAVIAGIVASHWMWVAPLLPFAGVLALLVGQRLNLIRFDHEPLSSSAGPGHA
jgi:uncharacterized membrane protein YoaK (UPF0700 family)